MFLETVVTKNGVCGNGNGTLGASANGSGPREQRQFDNRQADNRQADHRGARVLVADDNDDIRELLTELLQEEGYATAAAADGDAAAEALQAGGFDLAIVDVMMPRRSGFAVCRASKLAAPLTPVILVTGLDSREDRIQGIEAGADDFLSKPLNREELLSRVRSLVRMKRYTDELESAESVLGSLAESIEAKDSYTEGHCERLARLSSGLARSLGLKDQECLALKRAGLVHDIGKVAVPEHILLKPGPLTAEEWQVMQLHPVTGERICAPLKSFRAVLPIIRHHHERYDGSGYPDGLKGEEIPYTARLLQVVDVYDALTTDRPYRKALDMDEAFRIMESEVRRGWMEPNLMREFQEYVGHAEMTRNGMARAVAV